MKEILKNFVSDVLFDASCKLLNKLNVRFDQVSSEPYNIKDEWRETFNAEIPQYADSLLNQIQASYFVGYVNDERFESDDEQQRYKGMFIFAADYKPNVNPTRTDMTGLTRLFNRLSSDMPVIAILRQGSLLSIATCERTQYQQQWRQRQGERVGKVSILRGIDCNTPHRGHLDILESLVADKKIKTFDDLYNHWQSVFSTELLTKKFYGELFEWYKWVAIDHDLDITFPNDLATNDDDHEIGIHITRLVTRMMFVWFIKQMRLIPDELFDTKELTTILNDFKPESKTDGRYYNAILQNLFFATLNQEIPNRRFATYKKGENNYGDKNYYRDNKTDSWFAIGHDEVVKLFGKVPYLNGGLFECLDKTDRTTAKVMYYDGFSREPKRQAHIPNCAFFDKDRGLISIFNRYHFTIEENTPTEQQVALDPELLGKVFENLLGYINPETEETARKQSGSFYTPREIVKYMVDESIVAHLCQHVGKEIEPELRKIVNYSTEPTKLNSQQKADITKAVFNCRILDPACGSGAFPMGVLQQLVHVLSAVDPENKEWQRIVRDNAVQESAKVFGNSGDADERKQRLSDIEANFSNAINHPDYLRKLYLIEHCIYGIDIQPIAIQISKLRFFISLIANQNTNNNATDNFGIQPLPNLNTKFICANSLLHPLIKDYEATLFDDKKLKELQTELIINRSRYFYARRADKKQLAASDYEICQRIALLLQENVVKPDEELIARNEKIMKAAQAQIKLFEGENVVTEEYYENATLFEPGQLKTRTYDKNKVEREKLKKIITECTKKIKNEQKKKKPVGYDAAIRQLTAWDPYDVNSSSPFFDAEWMFGISDGFDIVIGNPPYIRRTAIPDDCKKQYEKIYQSATKQYDMYLLFIEMGLKTTVESGILCYINPIRFFNSDYGLGCRKFLSRNNTIISILDVSQLQVFETASTYPCIMTIRNGIRSNGHNISYRRLNNLEQISNVLYCKQIQIEQQTIAKDSKCRFLIGESIDFNIVDVIEGKSKWPLGEMYDVARGLANSLVNFEGNKSKALKSTFISRYSIKNQIRISTDKEHSAIFNGEMVILPRTVISLSATLKPQDLICLDRIYYLKPISNYNNKLLLALLNSNVLNYWFEINYFTTKIRGGYFDLNGDQLKSIPLPEISSSQQRPIIALVDEILAAKEKDPQADTSKLEREIDELVYKLYGLTAEEVKVVEGL